MNKFDFEAPAGPGLVYFADGSAYFLQDEILMQAPLEDRRISDEDSKNTIRFDQNEIVAVALNQIDPFEAKRMGFIRAILSRSSPLLRELVRPSQIAELRRRTAELRRRTNAR